MPRNKNLYKNQSSTSPPTSSNGYSPEIKTLYINRIPPGLFDGGSAWGGGERKVPAAYNSKTINDNEMKFAGVVKDH